MPLSLPIFAYLLFFLILKKQGFEWRLAILAAAIVWGTSVTIITEGLSFPHLITPTYVALAWLAVCLASMSYYILLSRRPHRPSEAIAPPETEAFEQIQGKGIRRLIIAAILLVTLVGITTLLAPPNIWDAMEYHMPRITLWMSNQSVRFFPTPNYCQLIYGPWAEYAMMQTLLLWGGDQFANCIQFLSFLGCAVGVSLIAKLLGASRRGQLLAALVCVTMPEGILEASGVKNEWVISLWIICTLVFQLTWNNRPSWFNTLCIGLSAGLAVLTKGTALIIFPFLVLACWWIGSGAARLLFLKRGVIFLVLIVGMNVPQGFRCYDLTGSPLGLPFPQGGPWARVTVDHHSARGILANVLRIISAHFGTPSERINDSIGNAFEKSIRLIGADPNDPEAIYPGTTFKIIHFSLSETLAGNPIHLVLFIVLFCLMFLRPKKTTREAWWFTWGLCLAFVLFCANARWHPWINRYEVPLFAAGAAVAGIALDRYLTPRLAIAVATVLVAWGLIFASANRLRSLIPWSRLATVYQPRSVQYFSDQHETIAADHIAAAEAIRKLKANNIGIECYFAEAEITVSPKSFFIYPFLALSEVDGTTRKAHYLEVNNLTNRYAAEKTENVPDAVVCFGGAHIPEVWARYRKVGGRASVFGDVVIFSSQGALLNTLPNHGPQL